MGKKILFAVLGVVLFAAVAHADLEGSAKTHVYLDIVANIAVAPVAPIVDGGQIQTGDAVIPIIFRIDANTEAVKINVGVSDLYKGNDPEGTEVAPIPVNLSEGVIIDPVAGNEVEGGNGVAQYVSTGTISAAEGIFDSAITETLKFESSQNGHFSQEVVVTPVWTNEDDEKPQGEYSGYVELVALVASLTNGS